MFCALEKHNGMQRCVFQLLVENENDIKKLINNQSEVKKEIKDYHKDLFSSKDSEDGLSIETFLGETAKLSESQKNRIEGKISLAELIRYLKKCKNNVAPGSSGFTFDFYNFFWRDLKQFVIRAIDFSFYL